MKTTPEQRAELKALAAAATEGPWHTSELDVFADDCKFHPIATVKPEGGCRLLHEHEDNARYIAAANPQVVLALLADLEETQEELDEWRFTNKVDELCRRVDRAEAELAAIAAVQKPYKQDAERYRALRAANLAGLPIVTDPLNSAVTYFGAGLDEAIDAARSRTPEI